MIVPMKKVSLVMLADKREDALKKLRKLGLVHIEISEGTGEKIGELKEQISSLNSAVFSVGKGNEKEEISFDEALRLAEKIELLGEDKKELVNQRAQLNAELERLKGWGEINPDDILALKQKGVDISLFELPKAEYELLDENVKTVVLEKNKASVKCLIVNSEENIESYKLELPKMSTEQIREKIASIGERVQDIDEEIASYSRYSQAMKNAINSLEKETEFQTYATGMESQNLSEKDEVSVSYFKGYVEAENVNKLKEAAISSLFISFTVPSVYCAAGHWCGLRA